MQKKRILLRSGLSVCAVVVGLSCFSADGYSGHFYGGATLGGIFANLDKTITLTNPGPISPMPTVFSREAAADGVIGGVYVGFDGRFSSATSSWVNQFSLGGEISVLGSSAKSVTTINNIPGIPPANVRLSEKMPFSVAFSILPGYFITESTRLYGRVSLVESKLESSSEDGFTEGYAGHFSDFITGGQIGAGAETFFTQHWSGRIEYDYTDYESVTRTANSIIAGNQVSTKYRPYANQILFSVSYHL